MMTARTVVAATLLAGLPPAHAAGCPATRAQGAWRVSDVPAFAPADDADRARHTAIPNDYPKSAVGQGGLLLHNAGKRVWRSTDHGCSWQTVLDLDNATFAASGDVEYSPAFRVGALAVAPSPAGRALPRDRDLVYAALDSYQSGWPASPVVIARSTARGAPGTWRFDVVRVPDPVTGQVLPVRASGAVAVYVSPVDPRTAWLLVQNGDTTDDAARKDPAGTTYDSLRPHALYVTHDAGTTWRLARHYRPGFTGDDGSRVIAVVPDPIDARVVWSAQGFGGRTVVERTGPGETATAVLTLPQHPVVVLDVVRNGSRRTLVVATQKGGDRNALVTVFRSADSGRSWQEWTPTVKGRGTALASVYVLPSGDIALFVTTTGGDFASVWGPPTQYRWSAATRRWRNAGVVRLPAGPGYVLQDTCVPERPVDSTHRYGAGDCYAQQAKAPYGFKLMLVTFDSRAR